MAMRDYLYGPACRAFARAPRRDARLRRNASRSKLRSQSPAMKSSILLVLAAAATLAHAADITFDRAWARPTVAGQMAGGAFVTLTSATGDRLLGGRTPAAERVELHSMKMEGDVMRMRQVEAIELPAGKPVPLEPGGLHLMLMGLKAPMKAGSKVPVTLKFERAGERTVELAVSATGP
jgi:copper(I)-binding protein